MSVPGWDWDTDDEESEVDMDWSSPARHRALALQSCIAKDYDVLFFPHGEANSPCPPPPGSTRIVIDYGDDRYRYPFLRPCDLAVLVEDHENVLALVVPSAAADGVKDARRIEEFWKTFVGSPMFHTVSRRQFEGLRSLVCILAYISLDRDDSDAWYIEVYEQILIKADVLYHTPGVERPPPGEDVCEQIRALAEAEFPPEVSSPNATVQSMRKIPRARGVSSSRHLSVRTSLHLILIRPPHAMPPEENQAVSEYMAAVRRCTHPDGFQGFEDDVGLPQGNEDSGAIVPDNHDVIEFYNGEARSPSPPPHGTAHFVLVWGRSRYKFLPLRDLAVVLETRTTTIALVIPQKDQDAVAQEARLPLFVAALRRSDVYDALTSRQREGLRTMMAILSHLQESPEQAEMWWGFFYQHLLISAMVLYHRTGVARPPPAEDIWAHFRFAWADHIIPEAFCERYSLSRYCASEEVSSSDSETPDNADQF
ncbi:hypothetical protein C8T65DRAFT_695116 [Cerioporus squamosus]|nr:hypothetical protein C8T65DRAFT_695116 [Cerioporus squamosus]